MDSDELVVVSWILIFLLVLLIIIISLMLASAMEYINYFYGMINQQFGDVCSDVSPITYRESVYVPYQNGVYEKSLATALVDISFATSRSNCTSLLPIPNPPGFTHQLRIEGIAPISRETLMFAYIFWNTDSAIISFTGTEFNSVWKSDLQFQQVAPIALNGYKPGVLVHKGFYDIYVSIRDQLWNWWNNNGSHIRTLYITGHSLGGALSTICGYDFADVFINNIHANNSQHCNHHNHCDKNHHNHCNNHHNHCDNHHNHCDNHHNHDKNHTVCINNDKGEDDTRCLIRYKPIHYSFAAPRSGNIEYVNVFNERLPTSIRVNNTEDIIPALPPAVIKNEIYEQTGGNLPFTSALDTIQNNHSRAYIDHLPECAQVAKCHINN